MERLHELPGEECRRYQGVENQGKGMKGKQKHVYHRVGIDTVCSRKPVVEKFYVESMQALVTTTEHASSTNTLNVPSNRHLDTYPEPLCKLGLPFCTASTSTRSACARLTQSSHPGTKMYTVCLSPSEPQELMTNRQ